MFSSAIALKKLPKRGTQKKKKRKKYANPRQDESQKHGEGKEVSACRACKVETGGGGSF